MTRGERSDDERSTKPVDSDKEHSVEEKNLHFFFSFLTLKTMDKDIFVCRFEDIVCMIKEKCSNGISVVEKYESGQRYSNIFRKTR